MQGRELQQTKQSDGSQGMTGSEQQVQYPL